MKLSLYERPHGRGESRGILPLLIAAAALGAGRSIYGAVDANQKKQRQKGYIMDAYRTASQRLNTTQALAQQNTAEYLNSRGLATPGAVSPIRTAMQGGVMKATSAPPTTIGGQLQTDNAVQMGLERRDLDQKKDTAIRENKDAYTAALINSAFAGAQTGMNVASLPIGGGGGTPAPGTTPAPAPAPAPGAPASFQQSPIKAAMVGIDDPANNFGGVHSIDPLGAPGSSWNRGTVTGTGGANFDFNTARG